MTVSVPRFTIKLAGRECSKWNRLITQFKYTGTSPSKSSSKSKKLGNSWRKAAELNDSVCTDPGTQGQLPTMGGAFRNWRRTAESNGHELLCRQPLRQLASGANLLAGDQGFEPCRNGFGVRRSSCRVMSPVVRAAGLEPAREPGLSRPPLPIGLRAHSSAKKLSKIK